MRLQALFFQVNCATIERSSGGVAASPRNDGFQCADRSGKRRGVNAQGDIRFRLDERGAGLLLHVTSLPGPFESGDLGHAARRFVDFLAAGGLRWWQVLPLAPAGPGHSPYSATSVFAGSPALVSLERLRDEGLLASDDPAFSAVSPSDRADLAAADARRGPALLRAFERAMASAERRSALEMFAAQQAYWLDDWALFASLKTRFDGKPWYEWPDPYRYRHHDALERYRHENVKDLSMHRWIQQRFREDVASLVGYAHERGVALLGDAPIYVSHDSAEVWAHPELFLLDEHRNPRAVAGVPPDAFSEEGQLWGNPLWDWGYLEQHGFGFWVARLEQQLRMFDAVRLDHFIGFSRYYAIARGERSAKNGTFHPVPGYAMFEAVFRALGPVQLVAEDLGVVTDEVKALRDHFRLPGMSVLQFGFAPGAAAEPARPHRFAARSVVYTGTHDNDTSAGWFSGPPDGASAAGAKQWEAERAFSLEYLGLARTTAPAAFADAMVRAAFASHAQTAIVPVQDVLGQGREARMNRPGIAQGNWSYRVLPGALTAEVAERLRSLAGCYGRLAAR